MQNVLCDWLQAVSSNALTLSRSVARKLIGTIKHRRKLRKHSVSSGSPSGSKSDAEPTVPTLHAQTNVSVKCRLKATSTLAHKVRERTGAKGEDNKHMLWRKRGVMK